MITVQIQAYATAVVDSGSCDRYGAWAVAVPMLAQAAAICIYVLAVTMGLQVQVVGIPKYMFFSRLFTLKDGVCTDAML